MWIDTHAHLNDESFDDKIDLTLEQAAAARVEQILVIGIDAKSSARAVELAERHSQLFAVVGIQPNSLGELAEGDWDRIVALAGGTRVVAIGETGLDRYWDFAPIELQREYFFKHLAFAEASQKPVVIHCREAEADVVEVLAEYSRRTGRAITGVMHSYTGDDDTAQRCLELGLHISFAGMVTFKKNDALREVAARVPLDRLLVETDSPYLSPEPKRGKPNQPAHVVHTGARLAEVHGVPVDALAEATTKNARRLFRGL